MGTIGHDIPYLSPSHQHWSALPFVDKFSNILSISSWVSQSTTNDMIGGNVMGYPTLISFAMNS
jgi:hypothetical protein